MDHEYARQIADLLNGQNQLAGGYDAARVLAHAGEYLIDLSDDGRVACCAQLKRCSGINRKSLTSPRIPTSFGRGAA
jgi:hypothetical protein